jgi:hypothetical protein
LITVVEFVPLPWGRIALGANATDTATFVLYPVNRRR